MASATANGLIRSMMRGPMPGTRVRSSTEVNHPLARRSAAMRWASPGPIPGRRSS